MCLLIVIACTVTLNLCLTCVCVFIKVLYYATRKGVYSQVLLFTPTRVGHIITLLNLYYKTGKTYMYDLSCRSSTICKFIIHQNRSITLRVINVTVCYIFCMRGTSG